MQSSEHNEHEETWPRVANSKLTNQLELRQGSKPHHVKTMRGLCTALDWRLKSSKLQVGTLLTKRANSASAAIKIGTHTSRVGKVHVHRFVIEDDLADR